MSRSYLGAVLAAQGRNDEARPLLEAAYERLREVKGAEARETRFAEDALSRARGAD